MVDQFDRELGAMASVLPRDEESPLVAALDNSPIQTPKKHTRDIHILSVAFLLIFLAYGAAQNLQSTVNTVSLGLIFLP